MMRSFNLLPWREQRFGARRRNALIGLFSSAMASMGLIAGIELVVRHRLDEAREANADIRSAIAVEELAAAGRDQQESRNAELSAFLQELVRIRGHNQAVLSWLAELPGLISRDLRLTRLRLSEAGWEIRGVTMEMNGAARLVGNLRAMPTVSEVRIERLQSESDHSRQFMLTGKLRQ